MVTSYGYIRETVASGEQWLVRKTISVGAALDMPPEASKRLVVHLARDLHDSYKMRLCAECLRLSITF